METVALIITLTLLCLEIKIGYSLGKEDSQTNHLPKECQDGWIMEELAFNSSPGKCQNYFQCWKDGNNKMNVLERSCAYNSFWSQKLLTCVRPEESECPDPCSNATKINGYRYGMLAVCGGYWQCVNGKSVANCCPAKEKYHPGLHTCIPDTNLTCNNTNCGIFIAEQECRHTSKLDSRTEFHEVVDGTTFTLQCPPGTVFSQEICACTFAKEKAKEKVVVMPGCKPSAYSSFDSVIPEEGIQCYGVEMINDGGDHARAKYVYLNGSAYVNIVTLSNSYHTKTLAISFWIRPDGNFNHTQTILTNHMQMRRNCKDLKCEGSVEIRLRPNNKLFTFVVSENRRLKLITNVTFGEWNHVWFVYESEKVGVFGVKSGTSESYIIHEGIIDQRMSGLIIGRPSITWKSDYFTGAIDEFKVYKCIPDEAKETLSFI